MPEERDDLYHRDDIWPDPPHKEMVQDFLQKTTGLGYTPNRPTTADLIAGIMAESDPAAFFNTEPITPTQLGRYLKEQMVVLKEGAPTLFPMFFGRQYKGVEAWHDWRIPAVTYLAAFYIAGNKINQVSFDTLEFRPDSFDAATYHHAMSTVYLIEGNNPVFYVSPELLAAAMHSKLPENIDWENMKLPFEAATFIMPRGALRMEGMEFPYLTYVRKVSTMPFFNRIIKPSKPSFSVQSTMYETQAMYDFTFVGPYSKERAGEHGETTKGWNKNGQYKNPELTETHHRVATIVFNLLFIKTARPELVQDGALIRRVRHKKRELIEEWSPNIIGPKYRIERVAPEDLPPGSHASPRMHMRSGHFRSQGSGKRIAACVCGHKKRQHSVDDGTCFELNCPCEKYKSAPGPKYENYEMIWLEPVWVNAKA